jgi:DNA-binding CsgD family transcriptional regulator/PAS domain-containing protein
MPPGAAAEMPPGAAAEMPPGAAAEMPPGAAAEMPPGAAVMSDLTFLKSWITERSLPAPGGGQPAMIREFEHFFTYIFNSSPDGISILDLDFTILGVNTAMEHWYEHTGPIVGRKCHEVYHGRSTPCDNCPTMVSLSTGRPQEGIVPYDGPEKAQGTQELSVFPLYDDFGRLFCLIEYVREITDLNAEERTIEKLKKRIQFQDQTLQEQEAALEVLLRRGDQAARRVANDILSNIGLSVVPLITRMKERHVEAGLQADLVLLEERLSRITSPLMRRLSTGHGEFTQREREIAELLLEGKTSKEIAEHFCLTVKAVDFHRMNLRKKLRMAHTGQSLQSRLSELAEA